MEQDLSEWLMRFDWETNRPLSLGLISASRLIRPTEYGEVHFQLLADEWPDEAQPKIWLMRAAIFCSSGDSFRFGHRGRPNLTESVNEFTACWILPLTLK